MMPFRFDFQEMQDFLRSMKIPPRDAYDLPTSSKRFPDDAVYRNEISSIERPSTLKAMQEEAKKHKVRVHRIIAVTMGATRSEERRVGKEWRSGWWTCQ